MQTQAFPTSHVELADTADPWAMLPFAEQPLNDRFDKGADWTAKSELFALDLLRRCQAEGRRRIGFTGLRDSNGTSTTMAALLLGLREQSTAHILGFETNFRRPASLLSHGDVPPGSCAGLLSGGNPLPDCTRRIGPTCAIISQSAPIASPTAVLLTQKCGDTLSEIESTYRTDLMVFDLPPVLSHPDVLALAPHLDAVVLCAMANRTTQSELATGLARLDGILPVLGAVLQASHFA